ncbi:type II toxin-antitoxin system prevent-host-death family antitoxin [Pectobacterium polaris]|uniref:Type II toxin-antitoxin system prevent-host-death family antitoxin n=1 Tax=Pectobacterium polaris TaxID=2042057 RepID=A0AAW5GH33_9GAMM|nr:type II toxin-antitoxin system prevent-host-death family antitoxin [Pectobacterium polaris]MCL6370170.1 type II toxin-antitoxin system prevent-host-death family antitoxin [Pectobacterium polaris]
MNKRKNRSESIGITRQDRNVIVASGKTVSKDHQNAKLDAEFSLIMQRHGHTIEALHDR